MIGSSKRAQRLVTVWQRVKPILSSTAIVFLSNSLLKLANASLFVLITHGLEAASAGYYSTATSLAAIAFNVSLFGLDEMLVREVAGRASFEREFANLLATRLGLTAFSSLALVALISILQVYPQQINLIIAVLAASQIGEGVIVLCQALFVATYRFKAIFALAAALSGLRILLGLSLISGGAGLLSLVTMLAVTSMAGAVFAYQMAARRIVGSGLRKLVRLFDVQNIKQRLSQGSDFFGIGLFVMVEFQADVVLLSIMRSADEVAIYSAAQMLMMAAWIAPQAYRAVIYPRLSAARAKSLHQFGVLYRSTLKIALVLGMMLCIVMLILSPSVIDLLYPDEYHPATVVLQGLAFPVLFAFLASPSTRAMLSIHKEKQAAIIAGFSMLINLCVNLGLIPTYGVLGATISKIVSSGMFCLLSYMYMAKILNSGNNAT